MHERISDHAGRDKKSHVVKHSLDHDHSSPCYDNYKIICGNYKGHKFRRKVSEALHIKQKRPSLNIQDNSLQLFN